MATSKKTNTARTKVDVDTRQRLVDETLKTILDRGTDAVRVDEIAAAVEVTKGSLYWHFKDREALIRAAVGEYLHQRIAETIAGVSTAITEATSRDDYLARVAPFLTNPFDPNQVSERWRKWELLVDSRKDPLLADMMRDFQVSNLNVFVELMVAAQEQGILRSDADPRAVATVLNAVNLGSNVIDVLGDAAPSPEAWWNLLLFFIGSLFPEESRVGVPGTSRS